MRRARVCLALAVWCAILALAAGGAAVRAQLADTVAPRVLIVSIDGLRGDLLLQADVPHLRRLMTQGAYTLRARTIDPSYTVPAHVSMLTGVVPETHGVTWNGHIEDAYPQVPTLLELAHAAGRTTALVAGKTKLIVFTRPGTLDWSYLGNEDVQRDPDIADRAVRFIRDHRPEVMFAHFGDVDTVGHSSGWGSAAQRRAIEGADHAVGRLLQELDASGLARSTVIIVTADHGGAGFTHDPDDSSSYEVPWIATGPSIRRSGDIGSFASGFRITATFAVACALLNLDVSHEVDADVPHGILEGARVQGE